MMPTHVLLMSEDLCTSELGRLLFDTPSTWNMQAHVPEHKNVSSMLATHTEYRVMIMALPKNNMTKDVRRFAMWTRYRDVRYLWDVLADVHKRFFDTDSAQTCRLIPLYRANRDFDLARSDKGEEELQLHGAFPQFPSGVIFGNRRDEVIRERVVAITTFLNYIFNSAVLRQSIAVQEFFEKADELSEPIDETEPLEAVKKQLTEPLSEAAKTEEGNMPDEASGDASAKEEAGQVPNSTAQQQMLHLSAFSEAETTSFVTATDSDADISAEGFFSSKCESEISVASVVEGDGETIADNGRDDGGAKVVTECSMQDNCGTKATAESDVQSSCATDGTNERKIERSCGSESVTECHMQNNSAVGADTKCNVQDSSEVGATAERTFTDARETKDVAEFYTENGCGADPSSDCSVRNGCGSAAAADCGIRDDFETKVPPNCNVSDDCGTKADIDSSTPNGFRTNAASECNVCNNYEADAANGCIAQKKCGAEDTRNDRGGGDVGWDVQSNGGMNVAANCSSQVIPKTVAGEKPSVAVSCAAAAAAAAAASSSARTYQYNNVQQQQQQSWMGPYNFNQYQSPVMGYPALPVNAMVYPAPAINTTTYGTMPYKNAAVNSFAVQLSQMNQCQQYISSGRYPRNIAYNGYLAVPYASYVGYAQMRPSGNAVRCQPQSFVSSNVMQPTTSSFGNQHFYLYAGKQAF
ncbi:unnamed protein product [Gongylonema pulchrum]|uniref:PX domain-containing protein n=1 Tax=Gongylonema pulchrum TaxID=637853 RepID=A0A183DPG8_9BILA|nr:unnamed protein product [Gongylonema pulchrum]